MGSPVTEDQSIKPREQSFENNVVRAHNMAVREANDKINRLYNQILYQSKTVIIATVVIHFISTFGAIALFILSVIIASNTNANKFLQFYSIATIIAGLVIILTIITQHPVKMIRKSTADLVKITMIFGGFNRQIIQIDTLFRKTLGQKGVNFSNLENITKQVQIVIDQAVDGFSLLTDELQD